MKGSNNSSSKIALSGCIQSIPLIIEDKETKKIIKKASLYLHSSRNDSEFENSSFTNISLTAMNQEGSFHIDITKENCSKFKRKGHFNVAEWESIIQHLFPIDDHNEPSIADDLVLSAKFISLEQYYDPDTNELLDDDELPLVSEFITIDIKTNAKLPITVGSIDLPYTDTENDLETSSMMLSEQNLFNWLDVLLLNNQRLNKELHASRRSNLLLKEENECYKNESETSAIQHKNIIEDLLDKFYQVLNAKKDRIWELEDKNLNQLEGLNEKYINQNKFNLKNHTIDKDKIPDELDEVYTSPTKRKRTPDDSKKPVQKRRKRGTIANDAKEISDNENTEETPTHRITRSQDKSDHLAPATRVLSDREIVTSVLNRDHESPTTDVDELHLLHLSNDGSSESRNVTDYSDDDDDENDDNNPNFANDLTTEEAKILPRQSTLRQSNDTAKSPSDTAKRNSTTDYDSNSDTSQKESHQMLNSNTDEIADSLQ
ncbi:unnamed protein product [Debaryomyces tyrocola]|nr:unnamed protein product [Debaryomyces tyrocola]